MRKRVISFLMAMLMALTLLPLTAMAEDNHSHSLHYSQVNPIYADVVHEGDLLAAQPHTHSAVAVQRADYLFTAEEVAADIRQHLVNRDAQFTVHYATLYFAAAQEDIATFFNAAVAETDKAYEGDYLDYQWGEYKGDLSYFQGEDGIYYYNDFTYTVAYYTTAEQELEVDTEVAQALNTLNVNSMTSDIDKVRAIYGYITDTVTYDYTHLNDESYLLKYTAYAALVNKTAVCQGYAVLLYRMLREAGIGCRVVAGTAAGGGHAWNIIQVDGNWYAVDATWDAGRGGDYKYFLLSNANMAADHTLDEVYTQEEFTSLYPVSTTDYGAVGHEHVQANGWARNAQGHCRYCEICHEDIGATEAHTLVDGACTVCWWTEENHKHVAEEGWYTDDTTHWQQCRYCNMQMGELEEHDFVDQRCTVCGRADPKHDHRVADWYARSEEGHWRCCELCYKDLTDLEQHTFDENKCTVCGYPNPKHQHVESSGWCASNTEHWKYCEICEEVIGEKQPHTFEDYVCIVCNQADPAHPHTPGTDYYSNEEGHWIPCKYCGMRLGELENHTYDGTSCTVCGRADPKHDHQVGWYEKNNDSHWAYCSICYEIIPGSEGSHTYVDGLCSVCSYPNPNHDHIESDAYHSDTESHWKYCTICYEQFGDKKPHTYEDDVCTVCGAVDPQHTHVRAGWYRNDETAHWTICRLCNADMGEGHQAHTYNDNGVCSVCGYVGPGHVNHASGGWYTYDKNDHWQECRVCYKELEGTREKHTFANGKCTVCGMADPAHDHVTDPYYYGHNETGHWKQCSLCYEAIGSAQPHTYGKDGRCTVCNYVRPDHTHNFVWYNWDEVGNHYLMCSLCYETKTTGEPHTFVNGRCNKCGYWDGTHVHTPGYAIAINGHYRWCTACEENLGAVEPHTYGTDGYCTVCGVMSPAMQRTVTGIVLSYNDAKQIVITLTFADNSQTTLVMQGAFLSWNTLYLYDEEGNCIGRRNIGEIFTDKGILQMTWYSYDDGRFYMETRPDNEPGVRSNVLKNHDWLNAYYTAMDNGMVDPTVRFENGVWTAVGQTYDGKKVTMTMNEDLSIKSFIVEGETTGQTVSGSVISFGEDGEVTIRLIRQGETEAAYELVIASGTASGLKFTGSYSFANVAPGTYTLQISKKNHVTREYTITVGEEAVRQNAEIWLLGDVTGDGVVNTMDVGRLYAHVRGTRTITDEYTLACANVAGSDDTINTMDVGRLYAHVRGTRLLW